MPFEVPDLQGKNVIVTGANSGTGKEAARMLATAGASVIMAVRDLDRGEAARQDILAKQPAGSLEVLALDLADLNSVASFAQEIEDRGRPVDILLNNAGVMMLPQRNETVDGFERQFGTNVLGPFALTVQLLPALLEASTARVVTMTSNTQAVLDFDDLNSQRSYSPIAAYARSKLADLVLSQELARLATERRWPLRSLAAHPGNAATSIVSNGTQLGGHQPLALRWAALITPRHSAEAGAAPMVRAATAADARQGEYYGPRFGLVGRPARVAVPRRARDRASAQRLCLMVQELTGVRVEDYIGRSEGA